jgi:hypothetical protein
LLEQGHTVIGESSHELRVYEKKKSRGKSKNSFVGPQKNGLKTRKCGQSDVPETKKRFLEQMFCTHHAQRGIINMQLDPISRGLRSHESRTRYPPVTVPAAS